MLVEIPANVFCYMIDIENDIIKGQAERRLGIFSRYQYLGGESGDSSPYGLRRRGTFYTPQIGIFIDKIVTIYDQPYEWTEERGKEERTLYLFLTNHGIFAVRKTDVKVLIE